MSKILNHCIECLSPLDDRHFDGCQNERIGRLLLDKMYKLGQPLTWNTVAAATEATNEYDMGRSGTVIDAPRWNRDFDRPSSKGISYEYGPDDFPDDYL